MDKLSSIEIESIWQRVKRYIPTDYIEGDTPKEVLDSIENLMSGIRTRNVQGSIKTLLNHGFATENGFGRTGEFQRSLDKWITKEPVPIVEEPLKREKISVQGDRIFIYKNLLPLKFNQQTNRVVVRKRSYSANNLKITFSKYKGKNVYYVFNTRLKKRLSWGLVND